MAIASRLGRPLLLALTCAACAGRRPAPVARPTAPADLRTAAELLAAVDAQALDSALLSRALRSTVPTTRRAAALAIGQSRSRDLAPQLRALVADADSGVAANAAFAAGLLVDSGAVPALASALARGGPAAVEAAWSLGEIGEPARPAILAGLERGAVAPRDVAPVAQLLYAAAKLRPVPAATALRHATAPYAELRQAAAYAVGRPRVPAGVRALLTLAADSAPDTRASAARGLARTAAGDSLGSRALAVLTQLARDPAAAVRVAAVRSIATYSTTSGKLAESFWADPDANVRLAAAEVARELLGAATPVAWRAVWNADSGMAFRRALLVAGRSDDRLRSDAAAWLADPDWRRRAGVAGAYSFAAGGNDAGALRTLGADPDPRVRAAAFEVLGERVDSASSPEALRALLRAGLTDADAVVRSVVIAALAGKPRTSELPAIRAAYLRAATDRDNDARLAAIRYMVALWKADSANVAAADRNWLQALPAPADPLERTAAAPLPVSDRWRERVGAPRPIDWYEDVVRSLVRPAAAGRAPRAVISTGRGPITIELHAADAPLTVRNFTALAAGGYFARTRFHRVVPAFVAQDGDPRGDGSGGPGYAIRDEQNRRRYGRGVVGMALSGPNTGGSQYFITLTAQPHLDGHYTVFGHVVDGFEALDRIVQGDPILSVGLQP